MEISCFPISNFSSQGSFLLNGSFCLQSVSRKARIYSGGDRGNLSHYNAPLASAPPPGGVGDVKL